MLKVFNVAEYYFKQLTSIIKVYSIEECEILILLKYNL